MVHSFIWSTILLSAVLQMTFEQKFVPKSTGERCISTSDCATLPDGSYQWCDSCTSYISCWYHTATIKPYQWESQPYWDDNEKWWVAKSTTCVEGYYPCPPGPSAPPQPVCESTGMGCLNDLTTCPDLPIGYDSFYQFCGNCSTYIHCDLYQQYKYRHCASGTYFDAIQRKCVAQSKTCVECYAPCSPPTPEPPTTTTTSPATCPPCTTPPEKECTCGCSCSSKCE